MQTRLDERRCVPCEGGVPTLNPDRIQELMPHLDDGWRVEEGNKLARPFKFRNFLQAVDFVNLITPIAEAEGHHPDLHVRWGEVRVELWTHAIGGLSENDFILAAKIDRAWRGAKSPG